MLYIFVHQSSVYDQFVILFIYPVMLMGTLVYGIRYTIPEYICSFLVAGGVSTFALLKVHIRDHPFLLIINCQVIIIWKSEIEDENSVSFM